MYPSNALCWDNPNSRDHKRYHRVINRVTFVVIAFLLSCLITNTTTIPLYFSVFIPYAILAACFALICTTFVLCYYLYIGPIKGTVEFFQGH